MKTFLTILSVFLISCGKDKCESCTRTWKYKSYVLYFSTPSNITEYDGASEKFYACGDEMIEAEEKGRTTYSKVPIQGQPNKYNVIEGTGTCNCN